MMRKMIISGDDFGLATGVNEAIEQAHRQGMLSTTSLMVGGAAVQDAVERARRNPTLRVGLHITVCDGLPVLPPTQVPDLVLRNTGRFHAPRSAAWRFTLLPATRHQLQAEISAQFEAYRATGLEFDHVNGHHNAQLHPAVLSIIMREAQKYGVRNIRLPYEPLGVSYRAARDRLAYRTWCWLGLRPLCHWMKRRMQNQGFLTNDHLFGMYDYGAMDVTLLMALVRNLPAGVSEIHCHPAVRCCAASETTHQRCHHERELAALTHPGLRAVLREADICVILGYAALTPLGKTE
jgi:chitin disaccharide deacetylase